MPDETLLQLTNKEKRLLFFLRQLGWGEVKIKVEKGEPVVVYQTITNYELREEDGSGR